MVIVTAMDGDIIPFSDTSILLCSLIYIIWIKNTVQNQKQNFNPIINNKPSKIKSKSSKLSLSAMKLKKMFLFAIVATSQIRTKLN